MDDKAMDLSACLNPFKRLYPAVNEEETPLPTCWSQKDKHSSIDFANNHLTVQYKGQGKTPKDAASVRANHPIPSSCGIYYFEVKIISKGRDGYMGIGLSASDVSTNRLPGWDKKSYGYHGDDGNSFCCSGHGQPYGPTFTTGDVIGCCVNTVENTCFFTKNGVNLGIAFKEVPHGLYPTVGLQTPGEVVAANFGQQPFVFDIEGFMMEYKMSVQFAIDNVVIDEPSGQLQQALQKIVSSYLVHYGYCATAESFARCTGQSLDEELVSIRNRQRIQKLVLSGKMGEAINVTRELYPGLLEKTPDLLFMLKCRQFVEMVNGTDTEVHAVRSPRQRSSKSSPCMSPVHNSNSPHRRTGSPSLSYSNGTTLSHGDQLTSNGCCIDAVKNGGDCEDGYMESDNDIDCTHQRLHPVPNEALLIKILQFGKELKAINNQLRQSHGPSESNNKLLEEVFSLLAYADPWNSPVGAQLDPVQREPVCAALNSAILESHGLPQQPVLETVLAQVTETLRQMSKSNIGAGAFARLSDYAPLCKQPSQV